MTPPAAYTETTLAEYMVSELRSVATALAWTGSNLATAVDSTILAYGAATIAACTDIPKLRALARVEAWKAVKAEVSGDYDFTDGDTSYKRSQLQEMAGKMLAEAQRDAMVYGMPGYTAQVTPVKHPQDPYRRLAYESLTE